MQASAIFSIFTASLQQCDSNISAKYNLGWSVQFLSFVWSYYLMGYFEAVWQKKTCYISLLYCLLNNFSTFSCKELLHRVSWLLMSPFFFPTALHLLLCAAGQASQGLGQKRIARSRKTSDAAFPSLLFPFPVLQPSRLPWPWQWIRKWKWHLRVSSKFRTLWIVLKMCNNIAASKPSQLLWPWQWHLCLRSLSKCAIRKWKWCFPFRNWSIFYLSW